MSNLKTLLETRRLAVQNATKRAIEAERVLEVRKQEFKEKDEKELQLQKEYDYLRQVVQLRKDLATIRSKTEDVQKKYDIAQDKCRKLETRIETAERAIDDYEEKCLTLKKKTNDLVQELEGLWLG